MGGKIPRVGVKIPREILPPGGQAACGYLHPRGASCPGGKINRYTGTKSGYVNALCTSNQTKSLTFGGKSQSSNKNVESATWCKLVNRWKLDYYKNLEFIIIANIWRKNDKPCSSRALLFVEILTPLGKVSQNTAPSFLENLNLWCASFRRFVIQK